MEDSARGQTLMPRPGSDPEIPGSFVVEPLIEGAVVAIRALASRRYVARDAAGRFGPFADSASAPEAQFRVSLYRDGEGEWASLQCEADHHLLSLPRDDDDPVSLTPGMPPSRALFRLEDGALACRGGGYAAFETPTRRSWRFWRGRRAGGTFTSAEKTEACRVRVEILSRPAIVKEPAAPAPQADGSVIAIRCLANGRHLRVDGERVLADAPDFASPAARFRLHKAVDAGGERVSFSAAAGGRPVHLRRRGMRLVLSARGEAESPAWEDFRLDGDRILSMAHGGWLAVAHDGEVEVQARASEASRFVLVTVQAEEILDRLRVETARVRAGVRSIPQRAGSGS